MDPIAAFKKQQERNGWGGDRVKTVAELSGAHPRWSAAFDMAGGSALDVEEKSGLDREAAIAAVKRCMGSDLPQRRLGAALDRSQPKPTDLINFRKFCEISADVAQFMVEHPKWQEEEARLAEEEEFLEMRQRREQRARTKEEPPDLFQLLGVNKSKDIIEMEGRKEQALKNSTSGSSRFKAAGAAVLGVRRVARGAGFRSDQRSITIGEMPSEELAAPSSSRFDVIQGPSKKRELAFKASVQLPKDLPQMRLRGSAAACFVLRYSPDGSQLAGGFYDGGLRIFDPDSATLAHCLNLPKSMGGTSQGGDVYSTKIMRQGRAAQEAQAALGEEDSFAVEKRAMLNALQEAAITNLRWRPGRRSTGVVATVDSKGAFSLWEIPRNSKAQGTQAQPRCFAQVNLNRGALYSTAFTEDGAKLLVGGIDRTLKVFDMQMLSSGASGFVEEATACDTLGDNEYKGGKITAHTSRVMSICGHPQNESVLFSGGMDRKILVWDMRSGLLPVGVVYGPEMCGDAMDVSRDGLQILAGSHRSTDPLQVFDIRRSIFDSKAQQSQALAGHGPTRREASTASLPSRPGSPEAEEDLREAGDATVRSYQWRGDEVPCAGAQTPSSCQLFSAAWDSDARTIVAAGENKNLARAYTRNGNGAGPLEVIGTCKGEGHAFWSAAVSFDGRSCAFGAADGTVVICQVK